MIRVLSSVCREEAAFAGPSGQAPASGHLPEGCSQHAPPAGPRQRAPAERAPVRKSSSTKAPPQGAGARLRRARPRQEGCGRHRAGEACDPLLPPATAEAPARRRPALVSWSSPSRRSSRRRASAAPDRGPLLRDAIRGTGATMLAPPAPTRDDDAR